MSKALRWVRWTGVALMVPLGGLCVVIWGIENYELGVGLLLLYIARDEIKELKGRKP